MLLLKRTTSKDSDFVVLVQLLDQELAVRDGDEHAFYDQFNKLDDIKHTVVAYWENRAVGCGAIKLFDTNSMEIKRMYVMDEFRGKGLATAVLFELEKWTKELKFEHCVLETGVRQPEAIALYEKNGYKRISNYGQYKNMKNSLCYKKAFQN